MKGKRVFVYYNLHKDCFSVRSLEKETYGKVIAHTNSIILSKVLFRVGKKGRERVLRERRKNVHAGVVGVVEEIDSLAPNIKNMHRVYYNPYVDEHFISRTKPILQADRAVLINKLVWV